MTNDEMKERIKNCFHNLHDELKNIAIDSQKHQLSTMEYIAELTRAGCTSQALIAAMALNGNIENDDSVNIVMDMMKSVTKSCLLASMKEFEKYQDENSSDK